MKKTIETGRIIEKLKIVKKRRNRFEETEILYHEHETNQ